MWEFSEEQLKEIAKGLGVPQDLDVKYVQDKAYYWDEGERYITHVHILYQDVEIAGEMCIRDSSYLTVRIDK